MSNHEPALSNGRATLSQDGFGVDPFDDISRLIEVSSIIDGGAFHGTTSIELSLRFPSAFIYAFEPELDSLNQLLERTRALENIMDYNFALSSAPKTTELHKNAHGYTGSLMPISQEFRALHPLVTKEIRISPLLQGDAGATNDRISCKTTSDDADYLGGQ